VSPMHRSRRCRRTARDCNARRWGSARPRTARWPRYCLRVTGHRRRRRRRFDDAPSDAAWRGIRMRDSDIASRALGCAGHNEDASSEPELERSRDRVSDTRREGAWRLRRRHV
jgi:hypothetical protein